MDLIKVSKFEISQKEGNRCVFAKINVGITKKKKMAQQRFAVIGKGITVITHVLSVSVVGRRFFYEDQTHRYVLSHFCGKKNAFNFNYYYFLVKF